MSGDTFLEAPDFPLLPTINACFPDGISTTLTLESSLKEADHILAALTVKMSEADNAITELIQSHSEDAKNTKKELDSIKKSISVRK